MRTVIEQGIELNKTVCEVNKILAQWKKVTISLPYFLLHFHIFENIHIEERERERETFSSCSISFRCGVRSQFLRGKRSNDSHRNIQLSSPCSFRMTALFPQIINKKSLSKEIMPYFK